MADAVLVVLLLVLIWAAILVPAVAGAQASREAEFLGSIRPGRDPLEGTLGRGDPNLDDVDQPRFSPALTANARRRQVLGGLVVAMGATLVLGLLPTFRLLLVVHLFLVNSCLVYVGLLVHVRDQKAVGDRVLPAYATRRRDDPASFDFSTYGEAYEDDEEPVYAEPVYAEAVAGYDDEYAEYVEYAEYQGYDEYDEYEAEAAYVDELGLARPA